MTHCTALQAQLQSAMYLIMLRGVVLVWFGRSTWQVGGWRRGGRYTTRLAFVSGSRSVPQSRTSKSA